MNALDRGARLASMDLWYSDRWTLSERLVASQQKGGSAPIPLQEELQKSGQRCNSEGGRCYRFEACDPAVLIARASCVVPDTARLRSAG